MVHKWTRHTRDLTHDSCTQKKILYFVPFTDELCMHLITQVNKLLAAGADPALVLTDTASVPLFAAVRSGHTEVVKVSYMCVVGY